MTTNHSSAEQESTTDAPVVPTRVLFLCNDNAARSPMAEAILRAFGRLHFAAFSAGVEPADALLPHALEILEQRNVSSHGLAPKGLLTFEGQSFDYVVTLSDPARERAPTFPGADVMHWSFADPELGLEEHTDPHPFEHLFSGLAQRIRLLMIIVERGRRENAAGAPQPAF